jgi:ketosteroid isomerase-like protein
MPDSAVTHDLIDGFYRCINALDFEGFAALLDEKVHFEMIGSTPLSGTANNREEMLAVIARVGEYVDDNFIHLEELDRVVDGNRGVMRSQGSAHTRDGRPYDNSYLHMIRVENGRIVEFIEYLDTDLINRVLLAR